MAAKQACPHCGSHDHRTLADHLGRIGWCRNCHRTWEQTPGRPVQSASPTAEVLSLDLAVPFYRRSG